MTDQEKKAVKAVYTHVIGFYPELIYFDNHRLFLNITGFGNTAVDYEFNGDGINLIGEEFRIALHFKFRSGITGSMRMSYDLGLSDATCAQLYKYNLTLYYYDRSAGEYKLYDKVAIMRRYTINTIINE